MPGTSMDGRSWLTAKAYRALGYQIPDDIPDHEVVVPTSPRACPDPKPAKRRWSRKSRR